jgi:hypothetical protein
MTVLYETRIKRFIGLSTDTKPTDDVPPGSYFWAYDTGTLFKTYDGTNWIAYSVNSVVQPGTIDLQQAAGPYTLFTATGGSVYVEYFTLTLPNVNVSDDVNITSIKVETDTTTVLSLITAAAGAKANLTALKAFTYATPFALPVGKKIILTIAGGASDAATVCITSCRYRAINPAGYLS